MNDAAIAGYEAAFDQIERNGGRFTFIWNWPALFFGIFWYFYKGLWAKALIYAVAFGILGAFSLGTVWLVGWLVFPVLGTYDLYLLARRGTQLWESTPGSVVQVVNAITPVTFADPGQRLRALDDARARGVVNEGEYQEKLATIQQEAQNASRLADLDRALRGGVLTQEEYEAKRQAVLNP